MNSELASTRKSCEGCEHLQRENAFRGFDFCICSLGKFGKIPRPVVERVRAGDAPTGPIPAWCMKGCGVRQGG